MTWPFRDDANVANGLLPPKRLPISCRLVADDQLYGLRHTRSVWKVRALVTPCSPVRLVSDVTAVDAFTIAGRSLGS